MKLYLMRHGQAAPQGSSQHVSLTPRGKMDVQRMADFMLEQQVHVDRIWHSPKTRACQTAAIVAETLKKSDTLSERPDLTPESEVESVIQDLQKFAERDDEDLLIVSHMPFLPRLTYVLLSMDQYPSALEFHTSTLVCFELNEPFAWHLNWLQHVEDLSQLR